MPHGRRCGDPRLFQDTDDRDLQSQQQRLRIGRVAKSRGEVLGEQHVDKRPLLDLGELTVDFAQGFAETRNGMPGVLPHAGPLRAIARKQEGDGQVVAQCLTAQSRGDFLPVGEAPDIVADLLCRSAADEDTMMQGISQMRAGGDEFGDRAGLVRPGRFVGRRKRTQRIGAMGRQQKRRRRVVTHLDQRQGPSVAADDGVGVGAAEAKGIHARQGRSPSLGKPPVAVHDPQIEFVEGNVRAGRFLMQRRRHHAVVQGQDGFQHPGKAGYRLEVPDVGFYRTDRQWLRPLLPEALAQGVGLDGIADAGTRAMRLDEKQVGGIDGEIAVHLVKELSLRSGRWDEDAGGAAILVHPRTHKDSVDAVARLVGRRHGAQHHDDRALRSHIAIRRGVERTAQAGRGQHRRS